MDNILGEDIKSVIEEVGEPLSVYNHITKQEHEDRMDFKRFWGTRIPFENEYQVLASFAYDTQTKPGDRVRILSDNSKCIVANMVSEYFEGEIITNESFMYKCNSIFQVKRRSEEVTRNENYELVPSWDLVVSGECGLFTGTLEHQHNMVDEVYARFEDKKRKLFTSRHLDIKKGDKILITPWTTDPEIVDFASGEFEVWLVELIENHRLEGIQTCNVGEFSG